MIIYNVTIKVDHSINDAWMQWLQEEHIPEIIRTGCFTHAAVLRLIDIDESEGVTYAVQYHAPDKESYNRYINVHADDMRKKATDKWGSRFIAFRTVMQVVN